METLSGKVVCFTGVMKTVKRDDEKKYLESVGGGLDLSVTPEVNLLVVGKTAVNAAIVNQASANGIETIDEEAYLKLKEMTKENVATGKTESCFKAFVERFPPSGNLLKPSDKTIKAYEKILPGELIVFWKEYGFGNYSNGLIKVIDPSEYSGSLYEWLGKKDDTRVPILVTAFGDIFFYRKLSAEDEDVSFLNIHYRKIDVCEWDLADFFEDYIVDEDNIRKVLREELFKEAAKEKGKITFEEIYFFVPALSVGGGENIKYIDKGNGKVQQSLLFKLGS